MCLLRFLRNVPFSGLVGFLLSCCCKICMKRRRQPVPEGPSYYSISRSSPAVLPIDPPIVRQEIFGERLNQRFSWIGCAFGLRKWQNFNSSNCFLIKIASIIGPLSSVFSIKIEAGNTAWTQVYDMRCHHPDFNLQYLPVVWYPCPKFIKPWNPASWIPGLWN